MIFYRQDREEKMPISQEKKLMYCKIALILIVGLGFVVCLPYILDFILGLTGEGDYEVYAYEVNEREAVNGTIVHLTDDDLGQYPVLQILNAEDAYPASNLHAIRSISDPQEAEEFTDRFGRWNPDGSDRYVEYRGNYYLIDVQIS